MTHAQLVEIGYKWLLKNGRVGVVFKELKSLAGEIPDVIGFDGWHSTMIECKASRSDFLCDKKKFHRAKGMGEWRFYLCPKGLIKVEELPPKWGLIYVDEKGKARVHYDCRIKKEPLAEPWMRDGELITHRWVTDEGNRFVADVIAERRIMYTALRRLFLKGYMKYIYDKDYNRSTTANDVISINS